MAYRFYKNQINMGEILSIISKGCSHLKWLLLISPIRNFWIKWHLFVSMPLWGLYSNESIQRFFNTNTFLHIIMLYCDSFIMGLFEKINLCKLNFKFIVWGGFLNNCKWVIKIMLKNGGIQPYFDVMASIGGIHVENGVSQFENLPYNGYSPLDICKQHSSSEFLWLRCRKTKA